MSNQAHLLPVRLREAAAAIANARAGRRGAASVANVLDLLPQDLFAAVVDDATAALDAAQAASPDPAMRPIDPQALRVNLAASVGLDLAAQATVVIDIARDGTVHSSSWAEGGGTRSRAIGEWANGLVWTQLSAVPFQTAFGMGFDGRPTPLTERQRATLSETQRGFVDRNTILPGSPEATARPLDSGDAEALGLALDAGSVLVLVRDQNSVARAALWARSAEATVLGPAEAHAVWGAVSWVIRSLPDEPPSPDSSPTAPEQEPRP